MPDMMKFTRLAAFLLAFVIAVPALAGEFNQPWKKRDVSFVLDAYEFTPIKWDRLKENRNLVGFINKASDGLPPKYRCPSRDSLCGVKWRRYAVTKELYHTRRALAKSMGLKWGAYHLARPGNPIEQAQHFLRFAQPEDDELIALDIEDNTNKWMSLTDAETFAHYIKARTGRYPVLYTNHNTSQYIARNKDRYKLLSRLNLWYARYRPSMPDAFPMGQWDSYSLWQFSTMVNCSKRRCPHRIKGTDHMIDVNLAYMAPDKLRAAWPFAELTAREHEPEKPVVPQIMVEAPEAEVADIPTIELATMPKAKPVAEPDVQVAEKPKSPARETISTLAPIIAASYAPYEFGRNESVLLSALKSPSYAAELRRMWVVDAPVPKWRPGSRVAKRSAVRFLDDVVDRFHSLQRIVMPAEIFRTSDGVTGCFGHTANIESGRVRHKPCRNQSTICRSDIRRSVLASQRPLV